MNSATDAAPLLLLPGNLCDERLYRSQIDCFSPDREVIVGDISRHDSIQGIARQILELGSETFALAGLSMGGIIAFEIMRQAPHRVERLALLDTNPGSALQRHRHTRLSAMQLIEDGGLPALISLINGSFFPCYVAGSHLQNQALKDCVVEMARDAGVKTFMRQARALLKCPSFWPSLAAIRCLALQGGSSRATVSSRKTSA